jgi:hypothetical protein
MRINTALFFFIVSGFLATLINLDANTGTSSLVNRRANTVEEKRFSKHMWSQPTTNSIINKRFAFEHWNKHFSSLGSKRAPIKLTEKREKIEFTTNLIDREEVNYDMSRWNQRMADLHQNAGIQMDDRAQLAVNSKLYHMLLQDRKKFGDLGKEVSLSDINRYQFRRNRSDEDIPVNKAGSD